MLHWHFCFQALVPGGLRCDLGALGHGLGGSDRTLQQQKCGPCREGVERVTAALPQFRGRSPRWCHCHPASGVVLVAQVIVVCWGFMVPMHLDLQLLGSAYIGHSYRKWKSLTRT